MPKELITQSELDELKLQHRPSFVPLTEEENVVKVFDTETGIAQRRLSNGISINYKVTSQLFASCYSSGDRRIFTFLCLFACSSAFVPCPLQP